MALAVVVSLASQRVVAMPFGEDTVFRKQNDNGRNQEIDLASMAAFLLAFEIAAKGVRVLNRPH